MSRSCGARLATCVVLVGVLGFQADGLSQCIAPQFREPVFQNFRLYAPLAADLDDDGILDLVPGSSMALGRGDGSFEMLVPIVAGDSGAAFDPIVPLRARLVGR